MRSRLGIALLCAACAAPARPAARLAPPAPPDDAVELAAWLPERADRCVVARPGRVPARRRELVLRQSWADPNVWDEDLGVAAYARAEATRLDGDRALRSYFRFAGTPAQIRERARALPFRWDLDVCHGVACARPVARWVDERTVEVSQREWPARPRGLDTVACARLARSRPEAAEVAARTGAAPRWAPFALRVERAITAGRRGIQLRTELPFERVEDAEQALAHVPEIHETVLDSLTPLESRDRTARRHGALVQVVDEHSWTDLELARDDQRQEMEASAYYAQRATPLPVAEVDVARLEVVRHQVRLRAGAMERARGPAREAAASALAALLARAEAAHPAELWIAERLARVWLDELAAHAPARALAERVLASGLAPDPEPWRALRREAIAGGGAAALAAALADDGLAEPGADARRAGEDLARLAADGVAYEWAEGAWRLGRELGGPADVVPVQGTLSRRGVLPALIALARLASPASGVTVLVAVATGAEHAPHAAGRSGPEVVVTRGRGGGSRIVGALASVDLLEARRLAEAIDPRIGPGPVTYAVWLREPGSSAGVQMRVEGVVRGDDRLVVRRASRVLGGVALADVERLVARPLADAAPALFPPPELVIRDASDEDAAALWREAELHAPGACASAGPIVRCRAPGRPELLTELVLGVARARLGPLLQPPP